MVLFGVALLLLACQLSTMFNMHNIRKIVSTSITKGTPIEPSSFKVANIYMFLFDVMFWTVCTVSILAQDSLNALSYIALVLVGYGAFKTAKLLIVTIQLPPTELVACHIKALQSYGDPK